VERVIWIFPKHQKSYFNYNETINIGFDPEKQEISTNSDYFLFASSPDAMLKNPSTVNSYFSLLSFNYTSQTWRIKKISKI
jgi:hypothetical protein